MTFWLIIAILLGLLFGSFGSVILFRRGESTTLKQASSILWGRSECPYCKTKLQARDLIPLFSFLFQWGKCRYCRKKISWLYPILEFGSAIIFWSIRRFFADAWLGTVLFWTITGRILWLLVVYDVLWFEVHIPLLIIASWILFFAMGYGIFPRYALWWGVIFVIFFWILYWIAKFWVQIKYQENEEGLGSWDVILAPYLWTLLFCGLSTEMLFIDKILAAAFFLLFTWIIGLLRFLIQNKNYGKKANFLKHRMANNSLPLVPAMILAIVIILIFQEYLFWYFFL